MDTASEPATNRPEPTASGRARRAIPARDYAAIAGGQSVAVAVPSEWQEAGKPQALAAGSVLRFLDESGRPVEITAAALERAAAKSSVLRPEDLRKIALAAR